MDWQERPVVRERMHWVVWPGKPDVYYVAPRLVGALQSAAVRT